MPSGISVLDLPSDLTPDPDGFVHVFDAEGNDYKVKVKDLPSASSAGESALVETATETTEGVVELATEAEVNNPTTSGNQVVRAKHSLIKKVGQALILPAATGAFSGYAGNARGTGAVDIAGNRSAATQVASGNYSFNAGSEGAASGVRSTHFGRRGTASGYDSTHFGVGGTVSGSGSTHFGNSGTASGYYAAHFGYNGTASGYYSAHFGYEGIASGSSSTHFGSNGTASGYYSVHFGGRGTASGYYSTHFGAGGTASGYYSTHFGNNGTASGSYSTHFGIEGTASGRGSTHFGGDGTSSGVYSTHFGDSGNATRRTQIVISGGSFTARGDAQRSFFSMRRATTNATPAIMTLPESFGLVDETTYGITLDVIARQNTGGINAYYKRQILVERTGGICSLVESNTIGTDIESDAALDLSIAVNNTTNRLEITVRGKASTLLRWVASLDITETQYAN